MGTMPTGVWMRAFFALALLLGFSTVASADVVKPKSFVPAGVVARTEPVAGAPIVGVILNGTSDPEAT